MYNNLVGSAVARCMAEFAAENARLFNLGNTHDYRDSALENVGLYIPTSAVGGGCLRACCLRFARYTKMAISSRRIPTADAVPAMTVVLLLEDATDSSCVSSIPSVMVVGDTVVVVLRLPLWLEVVLSSLAYRDGSAWPGQGTTGKRGPGSCTQVGMCDCPLLEGRVAASEPPSVVSAPTCTVHNTGCVRDNTNDHLVVCRNPRG
eukprot:m.532332 g.532332  ORF g.532332 m.532332 type:complete len:205 (+) comp22043_c0_seq8:220-834(+)